LRAGFTRRSKVVNVVPDQQAVTPLTYPPQSVGRKLRVGFTRRSKIVNVVPDQQAVTPLVYPPQSLRRKLRAGFTRRSKITNVVPAQVNPPIVVPKATARRPRFLLQRRSRNKPPILDQATPPRQHRARRTPILKIRRGRATDVQATVTFAPPPWVSNPTRVAARRGLVGFLRRGTRGSAGWLTNLVAPPVYPTTFAGPTREYDIDISRHGDVRWIGTSGKTVVRYNGVWSVVENPVQDFLDSCDRVYRGGYTYTLTQDQATELHDAGFGAYLY
jgi:hypothetical protein